MNPQWHIPRRTFLKGLGATIALPVLEAMTPPRLLASTAKGAASTLPRRAAFIYVPNGINMEDWIPKTTGADYQLPPILEPLHNVKSKFQVLTGLAHDKAFPNGDGAGDHARANATFLTGCQARKTAGADIKVGISADQIAARKIGHLTKLPSLELGCDRARLAGSCDSGYSCAYQFNLAWRSEASPLPPETDPRAVFERLFGNGRSLDTAQNQALRQRYHKSILDFVLEDAKKLQSQLGAHDQRKLEEYLTAVRELEQRIERAESFANSLPDLAKPAGVPVENAEHIRLMYDLLALAFQTDTTRVATFLIAHDGSNRSYPSLGISDGHHDLSHHQNNPERKKKIAAINRYHVELFAGFLEKLQASPEGSGSLLDQCMIVYGAGIGDGNAHNHDNLPCLLAGQGGGTLHTGRHLKLERKVPMTNLFLAMLDRMDAPADKLGDSSGKLDSI